MHVVFTELRAALINAVDSDYSEFADALERNGVHVVEICPDS